MRNETKEVSLMNVKELAIEFTELVVNDKRFYANVKQGNKRLKVSTREMWRFLGKVLPPVIYQVFLIFFLEEMGNHGYKLVEKRASDNLYSKTDYIFERVVP